MDELRTILPRGYKLGEYTISSCISMGGSGITYFVEDRTDIIIKELFPKKYAENVLYRNADDNVIYCNTNIEGAQKIKKELEELLNKEIANQNQARIKYENLFQIEKINLNINEKNDNPKSIKIYAKISTDKGLTLEDCISQGDYTNTISEAFTYTRMLLESLLYSHDHGILHLDIKPSNCYKTDNPSHIRLIDFGSSINKKELPDQLMYFSSYSDGFSAPELEDLFEAVSKYNITKEFGDTDDKNEKLKYVDFYRSIINEQTDYYSVGAVLYYLLFGKKYDGNKTNTKKLIKDKLKAESIRNKSIELSIYNILDTALNDNPYMRYQIDNQIRTNQFVKSIDKLLVELKTYHTKKTIIPIFAVSVSFVILSIILAFSMTSNKKSISDTLIGLYEFYADNAYDWSFDFNQALSIQGNVDASLRLAYLYAHGQGCGKDIDTAAEIYHNLYEEGNQKALEYEFYMYIENDEWQKVGETAYIGYEYNNPGIKNFLFGVYDGDIASNIDHINHTMVMTSTWVYIDTFQLFSAISTFSGDYWYEFLFSREENFFDANSYQTVYYYRVYKRGMKGYSDIDISKLYFYK